MIKTVFNLEGPKDRVFEVLADFTAYPSWAPGCRSCTIQSSSGSRTEVEIAMSGMKSFTIGIRFDASPSDLLSFEMTKCKDLKAYSGTYRLMDAASGNGTVVITELDMDAGAMVPKFMLDRVVKKTLDDTGKALQQEVRKRVAQAPPAPVATARTSEARRRARRIFQIARTPAGVRIWYRGRVYYRKEAS